MSLLRLSGINTYYGQIHILQGVDIDVGEGELVSLLGGNASGKSTTLKTILGLVRPRTGTVEFAGEGDEVAGFVDELSRHGILDVVRSGPVVMRRSA